MENCDHSLKAIYAIIVAAGRGTRMGTETPKQLLPYAGSTVLETVLAKFALRKDIDKVILVSPQDGSLDGIYNGIADRILLQAAGDSESGTVRRKEESRSGKESGSFIEIVRGGAERGDSVRQGLKALLDAAQRSGVDPSDAVVFIHDAARPGVTNEIIDSCIDGMRSCRALTAAIPSTDSVRMISQSPLKEEPAYPIITSTYVERDLVWLVQTPQAFRLRDIIQAYDRADADGFKGTDDASVAEHAGIDVAIIKGSKANTKITTQEDLHMASRIGCGYDVHRLVPGRPLILCGTPIPSKLGLDGHSDADVAVHALMDALLGAAGLGDIGRHFPDTDDKYKGADSMKLLAEVRDMLGGAVINNADITIIAQEPKLAPYNNQMTLNISRTLGIPETAVNIKATTEEGLGFTGRREGIAAIAVASIEGSI